MTTAIHANKTPPRSNFEVAKTLFENGHFNMKGLKFYNISEGSEKRSSTQAKGNKQAFTHSRKKLKTISIKSIQLSQEKANNRLFSYTIRCIEN